MRMIRSVALPKAILAGLAGAAAMEALSFVVRLAGVPAVDFVTELNSVMFQHSPLLASAGGLAAHLGVGVCWAVFYAFFFWGRFRLPPAMQGLVFAILPATLALLIVYPELALMRVPADAASLSLREFFAPLTWASVGSILIAHALFGLTVGAIYRRPVGYRAGRKPSPPARGPGRSDRGPSAAKPPPASSSRRGSSAAIRPSKMAAGVATRWNPCAITSGGRTISSSPGKSESRTFATGRRSISSMRVPAGTIGTVSIHRWRSCASSGRSRSSTSAISGCRTGSAISRTRTSCRRSFGICGCVRRALSLGFASTRRSMKCTSAPG